MSESATHTRWKRELRDRRKTLAEHQKTERGLRAGIKRAARVVARHAPRSPEKTAVAYAARFVGTVEKPAGSNRGSSIDAWQRASTPNMTGYAWCGAFVGACLRAAGVQGIVGSRIIYTPSIYADAKAGINGLAKLVSVEDARAGDLVLFNFPGGNSVDHVGIVTGSYTSKGLPTIEGNTSAGDGGSQSNGGGVFRRTRSRAQIAGIARPRYRR